MKDVDLLAALGKRIKDLRTEKGMSQQEFAAQLDYEKSNMSRMESGKVNLRIASLNKVAQVLGITLSELLDLEQKKKRK